MKILLSATILGFYCLMNGTAAAARESGWYGGAAVGASTMDLTTRDWNDATLIKKDLNNKSLAYKVIAGYRFTPHLAGELSYVHFGDTKFNAYEPGVAPSFWQAGNVFGKAEAKGMSMTAVATWPFRDRFDVFATGGILMWDTAMFSNPTLSGGTLALSDQQIVRDDGVRFIYGAGAELRVYQNWRMRLEWDHATVRFAGTMDRGVDFPSLGVALDF